MSQELTPGFVPEPPDTPVVIQSVDLERIEKWIAFLKAISKRIYIVRPKDDSFDQFYEISMKNLRKLKTIEDHYTIVDWPKPENVAFVLSINIAPPGHVATEFNIENSFFFCLGKKAFCITSFEWDGDGEAGYYPTTYSLGLCSESALAWSYVTEMIVERVAQLEDRVPEPLPPSNH